MILLSVTNVVRMFSLFSFTAQKEGDSVFMRKIVLDILNKYGKLEVKEERAKVKDLKASLKNTIDCPIFNFKLTGET